VWLAGDFEFMIEHIDIFEILPATAAWPLFYYKCLDILMSYYTIPQ
jgi:hypothetical protein